MKEQPEKKKKKVKKAKKPAKQKEQLEKKTEDESVIGEILTQKQERFCRNYTQNYEFFGNGTLSYAEAYSFDIESQPDNNAVYLLKDGDEVGESVYNDLPPKKTDGAKKIKDSSKKIMYDLCSSYGSRLRRNDKIQARCRELLNEFFIDTVIDARMMEIIIKGEDKDSIAAAKEYNALKQRVTKKVELGATDELKEWIEKMNKILDE